MATEIILPKLGQTMTEGVVAEWLVEEGQEVKKGQPIFQLESDKAVLDVNAPATGILRKIMVPKGATVPILSVVGVIGAPDEDISAYEAEAAAPAAEPKPEPVGDEAAREEGPAGVPAEVAERAVEAGRVRERVFASPRARRLARLEGVPLKRIAGSGPNGRIVEDDVKQYLAALPRMTPAARELAESLGLDLTKVELPEGVDRLTREDVLGLAGVKALEAAPEVAEMPEAAPPVLAQAEVERIPLSGIRARIAQKMAESARTTAAFTVTTEADASALAAWRSDLGARAREGERVPTFNDLVVRLVVRWLQECPELSARLEGEEIVRPRQVNVGVAVDTGRGLLVPVLRDAGRLSLAEIARETADLVGRARAGQLTPDDMSGGTFTVTNLGMFETDAFTPIINVPEVAILGVGRIVEKAVARQGEVVVRPMVVLSLTVDHRVVDGAPAARYLQRLKQLIEQPLLAL